MTEPAGVRHRRTRFYGGKCPSRARRTSRAGVESPPRHQHAPLPPPPQLPPEPPEPANGPGLPDSNLSSSIRPRYSSTRRTLSSRIRRSGCGANVDSSLRTQKGCELLLRIRIVVHSNTMPHATARQMKANSTGASSSIATRVPAGRLPPACANVDIAVLGDNLCARSGDRQPQCNSLRLAGRRGKTVSPPDRGSAPDSDDGPRR